MLPEAFHRAIADRPQVHPDAPTGVFATETACYEFMSQHLDASSVTLETGLGLSTVLFAILGCTHTSIFAEPREGDVLAEWARERAVDLSKVALCPGGSEAVLPTLDGPELDLLFIDGQHGYPMPQ